MAEFYLDVSAVGNEYQVYADTPTTWGVPQDGNGKAGPGHSAAVAVATLDCNGATASGTGTVGVLGVTVSSTLNASGAALATAIVTAINASATATTATYSAALLPLNRLVFARVNPGVSTEVQIMLRIAGTDWNGMAPTRANITGGGVTAFAGGADGPFAYLGRQDITLFGKAILGYGLMTALKVASVAEPGFDDIIHTRTQRSGVNLTVAWQTSGNTAQTYYMAPASGSRHFRADDGTLWTGDAGVFTVDVSRVSGYTTGSNSIRINGVSVMIDGNGYRWRWLTNAVHTGTSVGDFRIETGGAQRLFHQVLFEEGPDHVGAGFLFTHNVNGNSQNTCIECKFVAKASRLLAQVQGNSVRYTFVKCTFEYFGLTGAVNNFVSIAGTSNDVLIEFTGCKFFDRNGVYTVNAPVVTGMNGQTAVRIVFDGCTGITDVASGAPGVLADSNRQLLWENFGPSRDWRLESGVWLAEWRYGQNFPTLTSQLPGGQLWSTKLLLRNMGTWGVVQKVMKLPGMYRDTSSVKTFTLEFLAQQAFSRSQLGLVLAYIDTDDVVRYEDTLLSRGVHMSAPVSCSTSSKIWALNGQTGYSPYKLEVTTEYPIKQGTEYLAWVTFTGPLVSDQTVYLNGELDLT